MTLKWCKEYINIQYLQIPIYGGKKILKKCKYIPILETDRLVLRELTEADVEDLRKWLGLDEVYLGNDT